MALSDRAAFGIAAPQIFVDDPVDPLAVVDFARRAEDAGYASLWTQDQVTGSADTLEPMNLLAYLAACTRRVRLGVSVLVFPRRNPVVLAKMAATVDHLSAGRLTLGIGLGRAGPADAAFGIGEGERLRRFIEGLETMRALWADDADRAPRGPRPLDGVRVRPATVQRPHPPVWFGVGHPNALRRAARLADGWMGAGSSTIEQFESQSALLREHLQEQRRDEARFAVAKRLYVALDADRGRAERRLREWFDTYYGNADLATRVSVWGPPEYVAEQVERVVDAGAREILLNPVFDLPMHLDALADLVGLRG